MEDTELADEEKVTDPPKDTPADDTTPDEAVDAIEAAEESVDDLKGRITELEGRLTKEGRSKASIKELTEGLRSELAEAKAANEEWKEWYLKNAATPEEKAKAKADAANQGNDVAKAAQVERDHWKAIAEEENPVLKRALVNAAKKNQFMTSGQIESLRESLGEDAPDEKPGDKKVAPKVSGSRTTGNQNPSLDDQIAKARKENNFDEVLRLKTEQASIARTN